MQIVEENNRLLVLFDYNRQLLEEVKISLEGRKWDGERKLWSCPVTRRNLFALNFLQGKPVYQRYTKEEDTFEVPKGMWTHQEAMYNFILARKQCILAGEMRTGKTLPTLRAILATVGRFTEVTPHGVAAWWIAPKSALRGLQRELTKWSIPTGTVELLTYEKFQRKDLKTVPRVVVFDECQKLKNPKSIRSTSAQALSDAQFNLFGDDRYLWLLSGTPAPKDVGDWWNLAEIACPGFIRESNLYHFTHRYGVYTSETGAIGQQYEKLEHWKEDEVYQLYLRLNGLCKVWLKKDCLDLPSKVYEHLTCKVSDDVGRMIEFLKHSESRALNLLNKLRQISDGFLYNTEIDEETLQEQRIAPDIFPTPKDDLLLERIEQEEDTGPFGGGRMIVYCGFQFTVDRVTAVFLEQDWTVLKIDGRGWKLLTNSSESYSVDLALAEMDASSNKGIIKKLVVVAQADAASTGLELSASSSIDYYSNTYNGAARMQSEDRAYSNNMDKQKGLTIFTYIHVPTDLLIEQNLLAKKAIQSISMGDIISCI